jgi:GTP-binding protein Era
MPAPVPTSKPQKPTKVPKAKPRAGRVAIVGRPNVGKSTLLNALVGEPIAITSRHPQTTRDMIQGIVTEGRTQFVLVDTPGVHRARTKLGVRMNQQAQEALAGADAIVFLTDVTRGPTMRDVDVELLRGLPAGVPVVLVLNKIDRMASKAELLPMLEAHAKAHDFAAVVPVSALRKDGTAHVLLALGPLMPESPPLFEADVISDKPTRFFVAEFVREQILRRTREEVPHGIAVVVERFDEAPKVSIIELFVVVDKESHKKIVIGRGGSLLKEVGTDARAKVEALLGKQVHLKLWVKVIPRWYESDAKLRELGYGDAT